MAEEISVTSEVQDDAQIISAQPATVTGILVNTPGATPVTLKLFNHASSGSGNEQITVLTTASVTPNYIPIPNVKFSIGIYATVSTTADYMVFYK